MNHDKRVELGRLGGLKTKERLEKDPEYFRRNGHFGGRAMVDKYGSAWFAFIGRSRGKHVTEADFLKEMEGDEQNGQ